MTRHERGVVSELPVPRALLLDFGGVIVEGVRRPGWPAAVAGEVRELLVAEGVTAMTADDVEVDLQAGRTALRAWKNSMSRPYAPRESTYEEFWADFVAADWPETARKVVTAHAEQLCRRVVELQAERQPRRGLSDLVQTAHELGVRMGIVSNAMVGDVHREIVQSLGLASRFGVQIYSDEVGLRKPNPELIHLALRALDVPAGESWYVGDHFDRDVVCGRRAGVGAAVLMIAGRTFDEPFRVRHRPDLIVDDPADLNRVLTRSAT
jgi:HAD superfamily hydrolase (TIGR01549 family)